MAHLMEKAGELRESSHTEGQDRATWGFPGNQPRLQAGFPEHAQCWDISQIAVEGRQPFRAGREV